MKKEGIMRLLMMVVAMILMAGCASSRHVANGSHREARDSVSSIQQDSSHVKAASKDSSAMVAQVEQTVSAGMTESGECLETTTEHITETADAQGNKTTTTDRTTQRKTSTQKQANYDARLNSQEQRMAKLEQTVDSLVLSNKSDVGTHWAANDSLATDDSKSEPQAVSKAKGWWQRLKDDVLGIVFVVIVGIALEAINRYRQKKKGKGL